MYNDIDEKVIIDRDCEATLIPFGNMITLKKGEEGHITQALGGSYTIMIRGNLVRIEGKDADVIGKIPEFEPWMEKRNTNGRVNEKAVWDAMRTCYDPEIPVNIVDLGLIYNLSYKTISTKKYYVNVKMTLTAPGCGMGPVIAQDVETKLKNITFVEDVLVEVVWEPLWNQDMMTDEAKLQLGMM